MNPFEKRSITLKFDFESLYMNLKSDEAKKMYRNNVEQIIKSINKNISGADISIVKSERDSSSESKDFTAVLAFLAIINVTAKSASRILDAIARLIESISTLYEAKCKYKIKIQNERKKILKSNELVDYYYNKIKSELLEHARDTDLEKDVKDFLVEFISLYNGEWNERSSFS